MRLISKGQYINDTKYIWMKLAAFTKELRPGCSNMQIMLSHSLTSPSLISRKWSRSIFSSLHVCIQCVFFCCPCHWTVGHRCRMGMDLWADKRFIWCSCHNPTCNVNISFNHWLTQCFWRLYEALNDLTAFPNSYSQIKYIDSLTKQSNWSQQFKSFGSVLRYTRSNSSFV